MSARGEFRAAENRSKCSNGEYGGYLFDGGITKGTLLNCQPLRTSKHGSFSPKRDPPVPATIVSMKEKERQAELPVRNIMDSGGVNLLTTDTTIKGGLATKGSTINFERSKYDQNRTTGFPPGASVSEKLSKLDPAFDRSLKYDLMAHSVQVESIPPPGMIATQTSGAESALGWTRSLRKPRGEDAD